ncbi:MAG TPA: RcnB family protein [Caulobacteraceae bacterium]|jgi:Ni/Co efflux regulator RcnB|nr:RcnB family protein [Caulobacteraceae bacterium]
MKRIAIIAAAALLAATSLASAADAQGRGRGGQRDDRGRDAPAGERRDERRNEPPGDRLPRYDPRPDARRRDDPRNAPPPYAAAPPRAWRQGERLPPMYREGYVRNPEQLRLRTAPPGYDWVGVGPDIYLVQRSTGMVRDSIPGGY